MSDLRNRARGFVNELTGGIGPGARLARGAGTAFVISVLGTLVVFGAQVLLARLLGADEYGQYIYAASWVSLLVIPSVVGLNTASLRYVPQYASSGEWGLLSGFLSTSRRIVLLASTTTALLLASAVLAAGDLISSDLRLVFWVGCLLIPVWALLDLRSASLRGFGMITAAQFPLQVLRPSLFAIGFLGVHFLLSAGATAAHAMAVNVLATIVGLSVVEFVLRRTVRPDRQKHESRKDWLQTALPLLLLASFGLLLNSTDILMLGVLKGTTEAGVYAVASRAAAFVPFMLHAVNTMAAPLISEFHVKNDRRRLQRTLRVGAWVSLAFGIVVGLGLVLGGSWLLGFFGQEFRRAFLPLVILAAGQILHCLGGSVAYLLTMTGLQTKAAAILGIAAAVNILLNAVLIRILGTPGAALATALSMGAWTLAMVVTAWTQLGLNSTILPSQVADS